MHDRELHLRRTEETAGAAHVLFFFVPNDGAPADGADLGHSEGRCVLGTTLLHDAKNFRNHVARPANHHGVPYAKVELLGDVIFVMERRVRDRHAADINGGQARYGRQAPRAADLNVDPENLREGFLRRVLVRAGPAGLARDEAELGLELKAVDLIDDAVDFKRKFASHPEDILVKLRKRLRTMDDAAHFGDREPERLEAVEHRALRIREMFRTFAERIGIKMKRPPGGNAAVELPERPGSGVSRIGEELFAFRFLAGVERLEVLLMHDAFAADFKHLRIFPGELQRNRADRADVFRHVLAHGAVAAGGCRNEDARFVAQRERQSIELQFAVVFNGRIGFRETQIMTNAFVKGFCAFARKVRFRMNREHRNLVGNLAEALTHGAAHAKGRRRWALQLREARFEGFELIPGAVVLRIRHARRIEHVVLVAPAFNLRFELRHAFARFFGRHCGSRRLRAEGV